MVEMKWKEIANYGRWLKYWYKPVSGINPRSFLVDMIYIIGLPIEVFSDIPAIGKIYIARWYIWHIITLPGDVCEYGVFACLFELLLFCTCYLLAPFIPLSEGQPANHTQFDLTAHDHRRNTQYKLSSAI